MSKAKFKFYYFMHSLGYMYGRMLHFFAHPIVNVLGRLSTSNSKNQKYWHDLAVKEADNE